MTANQARTLAPCAVPLRSIEPGAGLLTRLSCSPVERGMEGVDDNVGCRSEAVSETASALELPPFVVDTRGVARLLGICERTVRALNSSGRFPRALALGRRRVWPVREIEAWLEAGAPERSRWEEL